MEKKYFPVTDIDPDPFKEFKKWLALAGSYGNHDVEAMTLATCTSEGKPSARMVLFKGLKNDGIVFYTNYESHKALELNSNPFGAIVFYWPYIYRQVRMEGAIEKVSRLDSEHYFRTRPRESQIAAWASHQSANISSFAELKKKYADTEKKFENKEVTCPPFWGGFRLIPEKVEFWLGQEHRMHHRYLFTASKSRNWTQTFLSP
jgi:pyridoxamine 5'-phosphate oxidase